MQRISTLLLGCFRCFPFWRHLEAHRRHDSWMLNHIPIQNSPAGPTCSQHLPPRLCTQPPDLPITKLHGRTRRGGSRIGHVWHWLARNEQEGAAMSDGIWAILQGQSYTATLKISQTIPNFYFFSFSQWIQNDPNLVWSDRTPVKPRNVKI